MLKLKQIASRFRDTTAAEIAEAALVLPLAFMFLLGIIWFGRAYNIYSTIQQAAQQGALAAARDTSATTGNALPAPANIDTVVTGILKASSIDPTQIKQWEANNPTPGLQDCAPPAPAHACTLTANKIWVCSSVLLNSSTQPAQCGAMVSFQYPYQFYLPFTSVNMKTFTLSAQAQSRMEN
jgi:Flp pilus assembly protein TadG